MKPLMFASDQANFESGIGICTLKNGIFGKYAGRIHTPFDTMCDEENIDCISNCLVNATENMFSKGETA